MNSGIYLLTNVMNSKVYVGCSKTLSSRRYNHFWNLQKGSHINPHLQNAFNKCGQDAFHFSVVEYCKVQDLLEREDWWMTLLRARERPYGYNLIDARRRESAPESIAKTAAFNRGKPRSAETKAKISATKRSKPPILSAETRAKMSAAQKANPGPHCFKPGHPVSEENKAKVSARMKGRPGVWQGKTHTESTRAKMSLAQKERHRREREAKSLGCSL